MLNVAYLNVHRSIMFRWYWGVFQGPRSRVAAWQGFSPTNINNIPFLRSRIFAVFWNFDEKCTTRFLFRRIIGFFDYIAYYIIPLSFTIHIITKQIKTPEREKYTFNLLANLVRKYTCSIFQF